MTDPFDRAPGAGRDRSRASAPQDGGGAAAAGSPFNQREPLRQPRTSPPVSESGGLFGVGDTRRAQIGEVQSSLTTRSTLSAEAPEFVPCGYTLVQETLYEDNSDAYYGVASLAELVQEIVWQLEASPASFDLGRETIMGTLNEWVTTEETLNELVELIYTQSTSIPNFAYTGARLCNYLSHNLTISPPSGNFRTLLLQRCQKEYEGRDAAVKGDKELQKAFHSYVLFLGELYLNLEIKGPQKRAKIILRGLKDILESLLSHPDDENLICVVKLLKLTGSVLEEDWKDNGEDTMDDLMCKIRDIQLDSRSSRDVKKMLLSLLELKSSNWGRVCPGSATVEATPDNDPNYFMNEPTFYTADGTPFTAADPEYSEKYQDILDREAYCEDFCEENGTEEYFDDEDEMDPEMAEAYEMFCLESEKNRRQ